MTDRAQFEAMLEALINEDQEKAKEIFHNIVVAKSREIYEELLAEDFEIEETSEEEEESVEEGSEEEEESVEEAFGEEEGEEEEGEEEGEEEESGDNPFAGDEEGEGEDDEEMDDAEQTDRILDLEDALEELKAEFEQLMSAEEGEGHDLGGDEMGADMGDMGGELDQEVGEDELLGLMEYVNQVGGKQYNQFAKGGDNGQNTKSPVAGKNDMGGTAGNIAQGGEAKGEGTQGGLAKPTTQLQDAGNINVPGGKAGSAFSKKEPGHGAEKKGAAEQADNKQSVLRPLKK